MTAPNPTVTLQVNGTRVEWQPRNGATLLEALRDHGLTGTKAGCSVGECGSCTVLVDDRPTPACLVLVAELDGARITTIEDVADRRIARMKRAFISNGALQCGACTPGMIIAASRIPSGASPEEIRAALAGNICRCTGYASIIRAVQDAQSRPDA